MQKRKQMLKERCKQTGIARAQRCDYHSRAKGEDTSALIPERVSPGNQSPSTISDRVH